MDSTHIQFSTIGELEDAIRGVGTGESVVLDFVGSCTLNEAENIYRRISSQLAPSNGGWEVGHRSLDLLRRAALHYEELDVHQLSLKLMELDLKESVPMKRILLDAIRATANAIATTADVSNLRVLVDDITIDSQRVARVCRGLGFGCEDVEVATLTQDDLDWLTADGAGLLVLAGDGGDVLEGLVDGDEVLAGNVEGAEELAKSVNIAEEFAADGSQALEDGYGGGGRKGLEGLLDGNEGLAGNVDAAEVLEWSVDVTDALAGVSGKEGPLLADQLLLLDLNVKEEQPGSWIPFKEETVIALMRLKIRKLLEDIATAKCRVVVSPRAAKVCARVPCANSN